ncbi:transcriptional regulator [Candidatus Nitrosopumilus sp. SW]|uniref:transcriptional regulator n=1 Tax=Candidatus Nitrosopumilus sp. SW TaxID=2508726 RepID=UPI001154E9C1|nr:transcriptional regulator [Candidatus Nitrosopumilus sp. SW]QDI89283.1 transcriptional regulator [Candidatus Nitrosopumilus sp. SW]
MAKKKDELADEAQKIKAELDALKKKKEVLDSSPKKTKAKPAKKTTKKAEAKPAKKTTKKAEAKPAKKTTKKAEAKPAKKTTKKAEAKPAKKTTKKAEAKPAKEKKLTKKELEEAKKEAEKTLEEELEEELSDEEIENFQIEKVDMERLTNKVCDILAERESEGMFQSELWKKLKLTSRDGSRLALKLERIGFITREKILEKNRWTYKLILKKTPISTQSIENSPCLVCPVEQKCSLEGEISPRNCQFIEDWVIAEMKKPAKAK